MKLYRNFIGIYYCTAVLVYSSSLLVLFWELNSLFLRFTVGDIVGFLSYQLAFALVESALVAAVLLAIVSIIPFKIIRSYPSAAGALLAVAFAISSLIYKLRNPVMAWLITIRIADENTAAQYIFFLYLVTFCVLPVIAILLARNERIAFQIQSSLDNLSVLAILYTALGFMGILIVIYRNIV